MGLGQQLGQQVSCSAPFLLLALIAPIDCEGRSIQKMSAFIGSTERPKVVSSIRRFGVKHKCILYNMCTVLANRERGDNLSLNKEYSL
jgi:hypothetical protein